MESQGVGELGVEPRPEDEQRAEIRARVQRFARIRSGHRALPMTASELEFNEARDRTSESVRRALQSIAEGSPERADGEAAPGATLCETDRTLDQMEVDLLTRLDRVSFAELRAELPRSVARRREDVIALVDVLIADRKDLVHRLSRLEYLVTVLATEELDGERKVLHDPVRLTPSLESIANEQIPSPEAEAVAIELFQAACPQSGHDDLEALRSSRDRKAALGLSRLAPNVLRAVVTYNARVFNRLASGLATDEQADSLLEDLVRDPAEGDSSIAPDQHGSLDDTDEIWSRIGRDETAEHDAQHDAEHEESDVESVYDNARLEDVLVALRRRLGGIPIGSCISERIALALDISRLEELERDAIGETSRQEHESIVAYAALVGLLLRDLGAVGSDLAELGVDEAMLSSTWLLELDRDFGRLVSRELADPERYARASKLSGIKTKHLLAPLSSRRQRHPSFPNDEGNPDSIGDTEPTPARKGRTRGREDRRASQPADDPGWIEIGRTWRAVVASRQARTWAGATVLLLAVFLTANVVAQRPTTVDTLDQRRLARTSPFLESAYRNEEGRGRTLIGRLDEDYGDLSPQRQLAVARELVERLGNDGVDEVMLYGPRGRLLVHSANGELRRPAP